jgi:hypothetical protein
MRVLFEVENGDKQNLFGNRKFRAINEKAQSTLSYFWEEDLGLGLGFLCWGK